MHGSDSNAGRRISAARDAVKRGQLDAAAAIADEILAEVPRSLEALEIKAVVAIERGDDAAAEELLRRAIAAAPKRRWPYGDLIRLLLSLDREIEAECVTREAICADPQNPDAHAMLASLFAKRERWVEAANHFERAISLAGNHPQLLTGLGHARMRSGRLEDARRPLEAAGLMDPKALDPLVCLAEVEERLGRLHEAERLLDAAARLAQEQGTDVDLQRSVLLARMDQPERALALLESRPEISGAARLQRGRLYDRLGRYAAAWNDWAAGKTQLAERSGRHYPREKITRQAQRLAAVFGRSNSALLQSAPLRPEVPQPIFVIGFPRSGTTLVEQILASHSAIDAGGELPFGAELLELATRVTGGEAAFPEGLIDASSHQDWPVLLRDLYFARAETYGLLRTRTKYFTDKMPSNDFWLPLLRLAFPESPVILVRRHPLDILTSVMAHDMTHGFNCGYRLEDAAHQLALVAELLESYREGGFGPTHELRYEALIADQAGETARLMDAVGLPMVSAQLSFHLRPRVSPTPSYAQVREPLNGRSIGRWRNYRTELQTVQTIVAKVMARGDYAS